MPMQLLPASAAAFAPRAAPTIVLDTKVEPWLTATLKRINKIKRPLHNPSQHFRCLTETLGGTDAIWTLASLMLPKAPEKELQKDDNPLLEALTLSDMVFMEAYVVHVDMVSQHEVAFKLTKESIDTLVEYHRDIYTVDAAAAIFDWPEKDTQIKKLQEDFVQAVNRFVFRTSVRALEGLEEDGAGELLDGRSAQVKGAIMNLFTPLNPPPPIIVDVIQPTPTYAPSHHMGSWWQPNIHMLSAQPPMMDSWRVLPSTPSPTMTNCSGSRSQSWPPMPIGFDMPGLPSPAPSYSQPAYTTAPSYTQSAYTTAPSYSQPAYTTADTYYSSPQAIAPVPTLLYPSQLPQNCGMTGGFDMYGFGGYNTFAAPQYATTM